VTHYHPDHIGGSFGGHNIEGLAELSAKRGVRIYTHKAEADGVRKVTGLSENDLVRVESGDKLAIGEVEVEFLHTPGHTPGSQCFRIRNTLVSGDTLFINGCGRVDLPGSNSEDMYHSLRACAPAGRHAAAAGSQLRPRAQRHPGRDPQAQTRLSKVDDLETWKTIMGH
jgi:hydroxyacylglutathione hydrolase